MSRKTWFTINNAADAPAAEVSIHDEIGSWGVTAKEFIAELRAITAQKPINLSLHSPGGEVFDGLAIYHALKARGNVNVRIEGLAASMASVIAMAGTRIEMPRNAYLMIHNPSGFAMGESSDMRQLADLLDKLKGSLIAAYRDRTKKSDEDLTAMMDAETWLTGEEAVAQGFADALTDAVALSASAFKTSRLTAALTHRPAALFDTSPPPTPSAHLPSTSMNKLIIALAALHGIKIPENASETDALQLVQNHKAPEARELNAENRNVVIDFEDADVKAAFANRITEATKDDKAKIAALETELGNLKALIVNGAAGAAGGNAPVPAAAKKEDKTMARSAFNQLPHTERNAFMAAGGKLTDD